MSFDNRLIIKHRFTLGAAERVNSIKFVENVYFVQVWLNNGDDRSTSIRLNKSDVVVIKEYLEKVEIKS